VTLRLVDLDCPSCGSAMHGEGLDTIFFCSHCGGAAVLAGEGIETVDGSALLPSPGRRAEVWRPAWRIEARVRVHQRITADGRSAGDWQKRRVFVIPAFDLPLDDLTRLSRALAEMSAVTAEVPREPIHGGTLSADDAETLVRHLVIGDEVRRSDVLASLMVDVDDVTRRLVALPFETVGRGLRCAISGVTVRGRSD
jgi:hypothetical protein